MPRFTIEKSGISGKGAFAAQDIQRGEVALILKGTKVNDAELEKMLTLEAVRWDDPLEIGVGKYMILDNKSVFVNHSCDPNTGVRGVSTLVALRKIRKGEEITFDYSTVVGQNAEGESDWFLRCVCGKKICRRSVGNWLTLSKKRLSYYKSRKALPDFVLKQIG